MLTIFTIFDFYHFQSFLVEVLGWFAAAESDYLFRVHVDDHALNLLIVRIMLSSLSDLVTTVRARCQSFPGPFTASFFIAR